MGDNELITKNNSLYNLKRTFLDNPGLYNIKRFLNTPGYELTGAMELALYIRLKQFFTNGNAVFCHNELKGKILLFKTEDEGFNVLDSEFYINKFLAPEKIDPELIKPVLRYIPKIKFPIVPEVYNYCNGQLGIKIENNLSDFDLYIYGVDQKAGGCSNGE